MSYRISYLVPKKEFKLLLLGKKLSRAVEEAPAKKSSTPSRKAKPKKASSAPRRHTKSKTTKKRERSKKVKSPDREKLGETVWCEEKMPSSRRGTRSLGMGEKSDNHRKSEMGRKRAVSEKEPERECGEIFR